jgi:hypothetical protein
MSAHVNSVSNSTHAAPAAAATQPPPAKAKNTEKPATGQALSQDSVKISVAGHAASQVKTPQK